MESRAKLMGHPLHPMLVVFPLGLLITGVVFDGIHRATDDGHYAGIAYWMIASGIIGGLVAAVPGWIDWFAIPSGTRAKSIGLVHGLGNVVVLVLFAVSWYLRRGNVEDPPGAAQIVSLCGLGLGAVTAWLGGELVDRLGVGVDPGAHLDSPNSLSGRPAADRSAPAR